MFGDTDSPRLPHRSLTPMKPLIIIQTSKLKVHVMSHTSPSFEPINEGHAIEDVVFLIDFSEPISSATLVNLVNNPVVIEKDYPFCNKQIGILTGIPVTSREGFTQMPYTPRELVIGVQYFNAIPFQDSTSSVFVGECMRINFSEYMGWDKNSSSALSTMAFFLRELNPEITRISLAYRDVFRTRSWDKNVEKKVILEKLFDKKSKYFPLNIFECLFPWHSHHGFFEDVENQQYKFLNNINMGLVYHPTTEVVQESYSAEIYISTEVNCIFDNPIQQTSNMNYITNIFEKMHEKSKRIITNLLTREALEKIGIVE